ncbi:UDP-glycosyltransferase UGT5-like [Chrysoperla carnea]|uniref:UDP-glycosyltransferase UGT5-like n=1 Tax=Chrysoperla carnea TaxID=189513 RepID=UPI001D06DC77|nr:UDP-glycosyltransferase UGT5-like [Chrysoperla carnea]
MMKMNFSLLYIIILSSILVLSECANVLMIVPTPSKSHSFLGHALGHGLVKNGHNVTMFTPHPQKKQTPNYHVLKLTKVVEVFNAMMNSIGGRTQMNQHYELMFQLHKNAAKMAEATLQEDNIQEILKSESKFDVIIITSFFNDALIAIGHHFNAPVIVFQTVGPSFLTNYLVGNPSPYSYVPEMFLTYSDHMTFIQRLINSAFQTILNILRCLVHYYEQDKILNNYFPNAPNAHELRKQVALIFTNSHRGLEYSRPLVPNIIEIGGLHVQTPQPLSNDLQKFMDNATDGVIYFSLGTNIHSKDMPIEMKKNFVNVFSKLKHKVLWKWDDESISGLTDNVHLSKWYPQSDLLAHPNLKLFITHGGLLSTTETVIRGVPCLGIPIFGDQQRNMQTAERLDFAVTVDFKNVTEKSLTWALNEALTNPK